jgi:hypothetical protein
MPDDLERRAQLRLPDLLTAPTSAEIDGRLEGVFSADPALGERLANDPRVVARSRALAQGEATRTRYALNALGWLDGTSGRPRG